MHWPQRTHHNSVRVVNDDKENILDEEGETEKEGNHTNSNGKATRIGEMI